ncbi:hypothetical protein GUITHDRAFT_140132 [Guillardia theta CCMP2712]|uniref:Uncharacterized protein n=1 Tax=Guillardia theta (strain CCMP2712) TaxID=905079 RepID=L1J7C4_GUITC|nr:hypothetical protein GUITHDRAFT_140132 [Guillardia theta CCMP2712]EKX44004.1 hypothetical protein GUITHDRAFT_140132 [Guillardia theta CCMP2712]|mmetsp:Transcript_23214/g.75518  ORF Transcript_23214/g.75518 Transcript_23214/m.75518 type:complete len:343 (-) Transcript_23214:572-1600(-)|eukprot:XP_005830984.1 hypothetical protein GUITHDRAFT_140132 [Guillardia theta CCMP2712]
MIQGPNYGSIPTSRKREENLPRREGISKRGTGYLIACLVLVTSIFALAVSTRADEYKMYRRFSNHQSKLLILSSLPKSFQKATLHAGGIEVNQDKEALNVEENSSTSMSYDEIDEEAEKWVQHHPEENKGIVAHMITGMAIGFVGFTCLLYSEIFAVLTVRDMDLNIWSREPKPADLMEREALWAHGFAAKLRPWLSIGGVVAMYVGYLVANIPMCWILVDFGLPSTPDEEDCITSVVFMAFLFIIGTACFIVGLCWSCTRPWAALLLISISVGAHVAMLIDDPYFALLWALISAVLAFYYFQFIPESREDYRHPKNVDFTMSWSSDQAEGTSKHPQSVAYA